MNYVITNETTDRVFDDILMDIEKGRIGDINVHELNEDMCDKVAGLGIPVFVIVKPSNREPAYETVERLTLRCVDGLVIQFPLDKTTMKHRYDFLSDMMDDRRLFNVKVEFQELPHNEKMDQKDWNNLIVFCLDHEIKIHWREPSMYLGPYENRGTTYRFKVYMRSILG